MQRFLTNFSCLVMAVFLINHAATQEVVAQSMTDLARKMPGSINSLMSINVDGIKNSDLGKKEEWGETFAGKVASGLIFIPDDAKVVLLGSVMDFDTFHPRETAILMTMDSVPPIEVIRGVTGGSVDELLGMQVIETPDDRFIARIDDTLVAGLRPALRPYFAGWLGDLKDNNSSRIKDYLAEGLGYSDLGTEVVATFNLENVISRSRIYEQIRENETLRENSLDAKEASKLIASVRGFTLGVTVNERVFGAIKIDFTEDISSLEPLKDELAAGLLERAGISLDEFSSWETTVSTRQIKLSGDMSTASLRKILSIVDAPQHTTTAFASDSEIDESEYNSPMTATRHYLAAVDSLADELTPKIGTQFSFTRNANWLKLYASKIDGLPTLNVNPDVLNYGNDVSQTLRDASLIIVETRENIKTENKRLLADGARSGGGADFGVIRHRSRYGYGRNGSGYRRYSSGGDGSRLRKSARQRQESEAIKAIEELFSAMAIAKRDIHQQMTKRFGVDLNF